MLFKRYKCPIGLIESHDQPASILDLSCSWATAWSEAQLEVNFKRYFSFETSVKANFLGWQLLSEV